MEKNKIQTTAVYAINNQVFIKKENPKEKYIWRPITFKWVPV